MQAVAALEEPTRRRLYEYVVGRPEPVSRDDAANALGLPRTTAAFHLDKLTEEGLLATCYERRTGRTGPGAGRPAKLYHRSDREIEISLPERQYAVAGRLLAAAVEDAETTGSLPARRGQPPGPRVRRGPRPRGGRRSPDRDPGRARLRAPPGQGRHRAGELPVPAHRPGAASAGLRDEPAPSRGPRQHPRHPVRSPPRPDPRPLLRPARPGRIKLGWWLRASRVRGRRRRWR